jgi:hypothetical protein
MIRKTPAMIQRNLMKKRGGRKTKMQLTQRGIML